MKQLHSKLHSIVHWSELAVFFSVIRLPLIAFSLTSTPRTFLNLLLKDVDPQPIKKKLNYQIKKSVLWRQVI